MGDLYTSRFGNQLQGNSLLVNLMLTSMGIPRGVRDAVVGSKGKADNRTLKLAGNDLGNL